MGRRKKDDEHEYAVSKLKPYWDLPPFQDHLHWMRNFWLHEGSPKWTHLLDPLVHVLSRQSYPMSVYIKLRIFCELYELPLKPSVKILIRYFRLLDSEEDILFEDVMKPVYQPPPTHWKWFRMAKQGLGKLTPEEMNDLRTRDGSLSLRPFKTLRFGLTYEEIAEMEGKDVKTIGTAIRQCKKYLLTGAAEGVDFWSLESDAEELSHDDVFDIIIWAYAYLLRNQKEEYKIN